MFLCRSFYSSTWIYQIVKEKSQLFCAIKRYSTKTNNLTSLKIGFSLVNLSLLHLKCFYAYQSIPLTWIYQIVKEKSQLFCAIKRYATKTNNLTSLKIGFSLVN